MSVLIEDKCCREKYWSERTDPEKIEQLRRDLEYSQNQIKKLSDYLDKLANHFHVDGKMVSTIEHPNKEGFNFRVSEFK